MKGINEGENGDKDLGGLFEGGDKSSDGYHSRKYGNDIIPILSLIVSHTVVILSTFQTNVSEDQNASCSFAGFKASLSFNFLFSPGLFLVSLT